MSQNVNTSSNPILWPLRVYRLTNVLGVNRMLSICTNCSLMLVCLLLHSSVLTGQTLVELEPKYRLY